MTNEKIDQLAEGKGGLVLASAVMRYVAGCMCRERERLAKSLRAANADPAIISAILDESDDEKVFRWSPPDVKLDTPPKTSPAGE